MTQCAALLGILGDGEWHTTAEILRAEPMIVHSRVSDLRAKGHAVEHETTGKGARGSRYRLVSLGPATSGRAVSPEYEGGIGGVAGPSEDGPGASLTEHVPFGSEGSGGGASNTSSQSTLGGDGPPAVPLPDQLELLPLPTRG